jgi:C4-dicarboxylate-specific signal transduction histidine kinase
VADPGDPARRRAGAPWAVATILSVAFIAAASAWLSASLAERRALADVTETAQERMSLYGSSLRNAVRRHDYLPLVLASDHDVLAMLRAPGDESLRDRVNRKLEAVNRAAGAAALYIVDRSGTAIASSNWNDPETYVGSSYAFRPYFRDALANGVGRFYGIGVTTGVPGYFLAQAVTTEGRTIGVAAVKLDLAALESDWARAGETVLLTDAQGVIFLASRPEWKYHPLEAISDDARTRINEARQYGNSLLEPIADPVASAPPTASGRFVVIEADGRESPQIEQTLVLPEFGWTLHYLADLEALRSSGRNAAIFAAGLVVLAAVALFGLEMRRRALRLERESHALLEQRVAQRTSELRATNLRLADEIEERRRASVALQQKQDELVQAGKLAAIGQLSAALAHEINQPLAAQQTFLASTRKFLDRGDHAEVRSNLQRVSDLATRMAAITQHLKVFARRTSAGLPEQVMLADAITGALTLLDSRIRHECVNVVIEVDPRAAVAGDAIRLEQVFLNLSSNALDAMADSDERTLSIRTHRVDASRWETRITDTGSGIRDDIHERLFDAFVTSKPAGKGLGLGLSLSCAIIEDFGGTITAANNAAGGATFVVQLPSFDEQREVVGPHGNG